MTDSAELHWYHVVQCCDHTFVVPRNSHEEEEEEEDYARQELHCARLRSYMSFFPHPF